MSGLLVVAAGIIAISAVLPASFGHSPGGDQAPPINFEGMNVTVRTDITPYDLAVGDIDEVNMKIRFFDLDTDDTLEKVTYRVEVRKNGDLLAGNFFYDDDGTLYVEVRPDSDCDAEKLHQCTSYWGTMHPSAPEALYVHGTECNDGNVDSCARPIITGPVFDKGGLYHIKVDIEGASGPKVLVAETLTYDTFISIVHEQDFLISTAHAEEIPVAVKTYYDDVKNFAFDSSDSSITFDMPFDWSPDYVSLVPMVHEEIQIPSSFAPYSGVTQFKGYVNGIEVDQRALLSDPYSLEGANIIHFLIPLVELERINAALGPEHHANKNMNFQLVPIRDAPKKFTEFYLVDLASFEPTPNNIRISWDGEYGAGQTIPFEFAFFDSDRQLIPDVWYGYSVIDQSDQVVFSSASVDPANPLISASEGIDIQNIHVPIEGEFRIDVYVNGTGLDLDAAYSGIGSALVDADSAQPEAPQVPAWIKNSVALWVGGDIDDAAFIQAIQFLVRQGVIDVAPAGSGDGSDPGVIPAWIKNSVALWVGGDIDDAAFIQAIQFLVRQGVIAA